jgi:uncharacterized repeat protein (TIGR01451 family)
MKNLKFKVLALILASTLVFNPFLAPVVWAAEEEVSSDPETACQEACGEEELPEESPTSTEDVTAEGGATPTPDPQADGDSTIETGDASSETQAETTANTNVDSLPGEITDSGTSACPSPEIETGCEGDVLIAHQNEAEVDTEATASATTGENESNGSPDEALIDTGEATGSASVANQVNTNLVILEATPSAEATPSGEATESALLVSNQNQAEVENDVDVNAATGDNQANQNGGETTITSGDAQALANLLNLLNTNIVGSDFEILLDNYLEGLEGDVDLAGLWEEISSSSEAEHWQIVEKDGHFFLVSNQNQADLVNNVNVNAATGDNQANQNGGDTEIESGDAQALANVINIVNLNLVGSQFFLGIINILGDFVGDLILPRPELFLPPNDEGSNGSSEPTVIFSNQNQAEIENNLQTTAETGENETSDNQGDSLIETGDAQSTSNVLTIANSNIRLSDWFFVLINHFGNWTGNVLGWSTPESQETSQSEATTAFGLNSTSDGGGQGSSSTGGGTPSAILNNNQAQIENNIEVSAETGDNQANQNGGDTEVSSGQATALANLLNLINLNILGGRWFMGIVNVLGDWNGNVVFAYPDVAIGLTNGSGEAEAGEQTSYTLTYENQGHDQAGNVQIEFTLPEGVIFLGDSSGFIPDFAGQTCRWSIGDLGVGQKGSFEIIVQVDPDFNPSSELSFIQSLKEKIISPAYAAEARSGEEVTTMAAIGTLDPESDLGNNIVSVKTILYSKEKEDSENDGVDYRLPELEVTAWNNVAEFVYPGDIVTFEITVRNRSDVPAKETVVIQKLFNGIPDEDFGAAGFSLGTIEPGKRLVLSFGLALEDSDALAAGFYHTEAQAFAFAPSGIEVVSNQARTDFQIKWLELSSLFEAKAVGKKEVLGATSPNDCSLDGLPEEENILPYVLSLLVSALWIVEKSRKKVLLPAKKEA